MDWTNLIIGSLIGFFLSIVANIYTDKYKDWAAHRTTVTKSNRIFQLKKDLERFSEFKKTPIRFYLLLVRRLFFTLLNVQVLIFLTFVILSSSTTKNIDLFMKDIIPYWPVAPDSVILISQQGEIVLLLLVLIISYYTFRSTMNDIDNFNNFEDFKKATNERIEKLA